MIMLWSVFEPRMAWWKREKYFSKQIVVVKTTLRRKPPNHFKKGKGEKQPLSNKNSALSFSKNWLALGSNYFSTSYQPLKFLCNGHATILSRKTQG